VRSYLRDRGDLSFSLLVPIAIFALMYGAFSGQELFNGTAHIVNEDPEGIYSGQLIERLDALDNLEVELLDSAGAESQLDRSDILLVAYIPEGFSGELAAGRPVQITFRQRGNAGQEGQIVASLIRGMADEIGQEIQLEKQVQRALAGKGAGMERVETTVQRLLEREEELPTIIVREDTIGAEYNLVNQFLPGIVTMFVLFAITLTSRAIVEERQKGTLERLLTTRLTIGQMFLGKFFAGVSRGFVQTLILLLLGYLVFQIFTPLSFLAVLLVALIFTAASSTLGLLIASIARSQDQAIWMSVFFTMATVMLGGTFFEISEGSGLYLASKLSLNTYANDAFRILITRGGDLSEVGTEMLVMGGVAVAGLALSRLLFRAMPGGK
jgi:ABC-2 type transport system permease protein